MTHSDSLRKLTNTLIEVKAPINAELGKQKAEYFARGGTVTELPNKLGTPRPIAIRPIKFQIVEDEVIPGIIWGDEEIEATRYMKALGQSNAAVALALNAYFGNSRTAFAVKRLCAKQKIYRAAAPRKPSPLKGHPSRGPNGYTIAEDKALQALTEEGLTVDKIVIRMKKMFGKDRTDSGLRGRCKRLGLQINRITYG
jgi:hypothetical protein